VAHVLVQRDGSVARVILSHPERRNAMTYEMLGQLVEIFGELGEDSSVRVIMLLGDGGTFTAGADISQFKALRSDAAGNERFLAALEPALAAPARCPKPVVGVLQDVCVGGGLELAASCDMRIAAQDTVFRMPAARLGAAYRLEGIRRFVALLGHARTADLFFSARRFDADEALRLGFVDQVVPPPELLEAAMEYCRAVAENAPLTIAAAKAAIRAVAVNAHSSDLAEAEARIRACIGSQDQHEGRQAFLEKRPPTFIGR
jgi:enoyl-CoA hydratase